MLIPVLALAETAGSVLAKENALPVFASSGSLSQTVDFDIPALPLVDALDRYAAITHRPAIFLSTLVAGRVSSPVRGRYLPQTALGILLSGSGLGAEPINAEHNDTFFLKTLGSSGQFSPARAGVPAPQYEGQVQARIWAALCHNPQTKPGSYRSLIRFYIDPVGRISQASLITTSGNKLRDATLLATLQTVRVGRPLPEMAQPVALLILPQSRVAGPLCREAP